MGPFQGIIRCIVVEIRYRIRIGLVACPAILPWKLSTMGVVGFMATDTTPIPSGLFQKGVVEGGHSESRGLVTEVAPGCRKGPVVGVVFLVASGA